MTFSYINFTAVIIKITFTLLLEDKVCKEIVLKIKEYYHLNYIIRKLTRYVVQTIKSTKKEVSGGHFDKHTASLFTRNKLLIRKLTRYVVQIIKSAERRVSGDHFNKHTEALLFTQNTSFIRKLTNYVVQTMKVNRERSVRSSM